MPVISIKPNEFFTIKKEKYLLSGVIVLFLIALVLDIVFWAKQKSKTTINGNKIYLPNSKVPLFVSVALLVLNFTLIFKSFYDYNRIFSLSRSRTFNILTALLLINLVLFIVTLIFALHKFNYCPDGKEFIDELNMCAEICPEGSYLNSSGNCTTGCSTSKNCGENEECINGGCCNMNENQNIDGTCCPNKLVVTDETSGEKHCCKLSCGGTCCSGDSTMYYCTKDNQCALKCGGENCSPEQMCYEYPKKLEDPNAKYDDKVYKCVTPQTKCSGIKTNYYPNAVSGFYGSYNSNTSADFGKVVDSFLNSKDINTAQTSLNPISSAPQNKNKGYICGLNEGSAAQFEHRKFNNCSDPTICLKEVSYPTTQLINAVQGEDGSIICNQFQDPNLTMIGNTVGSEEKGTYPSYYKTYQIKHGDDFTTITTDKKDFKRKKVRNSLTVDTSNPSCETDYYVQDCNKACNPCYIDGDANYVCVDKDNVQFIQDKTAVEDFRCIVKDNDYKCQNIKELPQDQQDKLKDAPKCDNDGQCKNILETITPNVQAPIKWCYRQTAPVPKDLEGMNVGQMRYGTGANSRMCGEKPADNRLFDFKELKDNTNMCGPTNGLKPYFFSDSFNNNQDCWPHDGFGGPINYVCCDTRLQVTDKDRTSKDRPYLTNVPEQKQYCIGPNLGKPVTGKDGNNYYLKCNPNKNRKDKSSYVRLGRGGTNKVPDGSNVCDGNAEKGSQRLNDILTRMNVDNFGGVPACR